MFCENCGKQIPDDSRFCTECGAEVRPINGTGQGRGQIPPGNDAWMEEELPPYVPDKRRPISPYEPEVEKKKKKKKGDLKALIAVLSVVAVALVGVVIFLGIRFFGKNSQDEPVSLAAASTEAEKETDEPAWTEPSMSIEASKEASKEADKEAGIATDKETPAETSVAIAQTDEPAQTQPAAGQTDVIQYGELGHMTNPLQASDFAQETVPDGSYSFAYPKNYFNAGSYDPASGRLSFTSDDGYTSLTIEKMTAAVQNDPQAASSQCISQYRTQYVETSATPYTHQSQGVDEAGYSRSIIGGVLKEDSGKGKYLVAVSNSTTTYLLTLTYYAADLTGVGSDHTPEGYILDSVYRGWSLSGSSYQIRSFDQYMQGDSGAKK